MLAAALATVGALTVWAQGQGQPADANRTPGVQSGQDPNREAFVAANCKVPPPAPAARGGGPGGGARAGGAARRRPGAQRLHGDGDSRRHRRGPEVEAGLGRHRQQRRRSRGHGRRQPVAGAERQEHGRAHRQGRQGVGDLHRHLHRRFDRREQARPGVHRGARAEPGHLAAAAGAEAVREHGTEASRSSA